MGTCARIDRDRRASTLLVLAGAASLGGAAALWRPAGAPLDERMVIVGTEEDVTDDRGWAAAVNPDSSAEPASPCRVYLMYAEPAVALRRAWLQSLGGWLLTLLSMGMVAAALGRIRAARRALPMAARSARPVPVVMVMSLILPMLPQLVLMHADCQLLPSLLLLVASIGAGTAGAMLVARRQLAARLRWAIAVDGSVAHVSDGTVVAVEVEPRRLVLPPGTRRAPWYRADLKAVAVDSPREPVRVALDRAHLDARAARVIAAVTFGGPTRSRLTVLGTATRVPADAAAADPMCRTATTQVRIGGGVAEPAVVVSGSRNDLQRRLRHESALLVGALLISVGAALLALA